MRLLALVVCVGIAGCAQEQATAGEMSSGMPVLPADAPPGDDAAPMLEGLDAISEAEARRELASGAGCTLRDGGRDVLVAVLGDAIVKTGGRIVHLKPSAADWNALAEGGRFTGAGLTVDVDAGAVVGREDEVVIRDASVGVTRGGEGMAVSHGPRWACGA